MQITNAVVNGGDAEVLTGQIATETFGHILSSGLPSLHRGAYRILGNAADAEDAAGAEDAAAG